MAAARLNSPEHQKMTKCSLPFAISLVDSAFDPRVQPAFVYQNRVKGVHGVLEHVCFVTERE